MEDLEGSLQILLDFKVDDQLYSDHHPLVLTIKGQNFNEKKTKREDYNITRYRWSADGLAMFKMKLEELREKNIPASDDLVYTFNQRILEAMSSAKITYSIKGGPRKSKPWFDKDCYDMKKLAKESLKKYRKTNRLEDRECYASSRKKYLALLDLKRKGFDNEKQEILRNAKDSKTFWKTIALYKSTSIIQGEISIRDWLNFYRELMTTEKNLRICNLHNVISQNDPILDSEITNADIYKEIAGLRSNKACGPDGIPNEVLKTLPDSYILLLKQLYNSVMTTGKYPAIWTNSTIHPIFKNGYKNSPSNYRDLLSVNLPEFGDIHLLLYADDIAIIGESRMNLQKKIKILKEYLDENLMTLNESKSKIMVFRNGGRTSTCHLSRGLFCQFLDMAIAGEKSHLFENLNANTILEPLYRDYYRKEIVSPSNREEEYLSPEQRSVLKLFLDMAIVGEKSHLFESLNANTILEPLYRDYYRKEIVSPSNREDEYLSPEQRSVLKLFLDMAIAQVYHRICQLLSSALDDELLIVRYFKFCTEAGHKRKNAGQRILEDDLSVNSFTDKIVDQWKNGASGSSLAQKYGVGNATIPDIKKNSDAITNYASALDNEDGNLYRKGIKLVELVDGVCWERVELINGGDNRVNNVFFLISTQSYQVKLQILREIEVEKKKKTDVAQKHNIPQSSLSTIIKNSEKIHQQALHAGESSRKRARGSTYADEALLQWFKQARSAALPVNGPLLSEKAKTLALEFGLKDFTGSGGWIERWKARHGIKLRNICGESADVNRETMTNWLTDVMPNIISNYACKDIFNADETGLFWRLLPDKTLHFKGETCTGGKASKERITILLCCNMDGSEKMQPLVIGKAKQPRCFRGIKHLPVQYEANQKAWMAGLLFESWVRHIDKKMAGQHRQIILLLDNCGAHPPDMQGLTNTRIAFLPPNTTSMLQCDQGIIRNFKMIYRTRLMRKYLTAYDAGTALTINLKQAVDIISVAWNDVLPATISNCWHHSGIIKSDVSSPLDTPQPATQMWEQQSLFDRMKEVLKIPLEMDFDSYADADNDVVTNAMLSDVEIVESILQAKEEEETDQVDEEVDPIVHIPHPKEVLESIQTMRLFLQCQDESKSLHRHLSDLDNIEKSVQHLLLTSKCQKKITNYFSKNT
ncbi:TIGD4 [Cordylochernes scorpioides]|uniref:TIGD4 n=1 Tax=Cordylochernes scorpioides TaxID=51811 RepID=A0ABY6K3Y9_9ARAC|nr:TIGD4 [Cordylochernes scorpioides]